VYSAQAPITLHVLAVTSFLSAQHCASTKAIVWHQRVKPHPAGFTTVIMKHFLVSISKLTDQISITWSVEQTTPWTGPISGGRNFSLQYSQYHQTGSGPQLTSLPGTKRSFIGGGGGLNWPEHEGELIFI